MSGFGTMTRKFRPGFFKLCLLAKAKTLFLVFPTLKKSFMLLLVQDLITVMDFMLASFMFTSIPLAIFQLVQQIDAVRLLTAWFNKASILAGS